MTKKLLSLGVATCIAVALFVGILHFGRKSPDNPSKPDQTNVPSKTISPPRDADISADNCKKIVAQQLEELDKTLNLSDNQKGKLNDILFEFYSASANPNIAGKEQGLLINIEQQLKTTLTPEQRKILKMPE